jgi:hypothetical protein
MAIPFDPLVCAHVERRRPPNARAALRRHDFRLTIA